MRRSSDATGRESGLGFALWLRLGGECFGHLLAVEPVDFADGNFGGDDSSVKPRHECWGGDSVELRQLFSGG